MLFIVAGVPDIYYEDVEKKVPKILNQGDNWISARLIPLNPGKYVLNASHAQDILRHIIAEVKKYPERLEKPTGLMYFNWVMPTRELEYFLDYFFPFCVTTPLTVPSRLFFKGDGARRTANDILNEIRDGSKKLREILKPIQANIQRLARSPLLLPIRAFGDDGLREGIGRVFIHEKTDNTSSVIDSICRRFEHKYPFTKGDGSKRCFTNAKGIEFFGPGRALHGEPALDAPMHNEKCYFAGRFRLGVPIQKGFHYDCKWRELRAGRFVNCHDSSGEYEWKTHIPIAPNDHIRLKTPARNEAAALPMRLVINFP